MEIFNRLSYDKDMSEKITGYLLLAVGILVILFAAYSVIMVFTKQAQPVKLFNMEGISLDASMFMPKDLPPDAAKLLQQGTGSQKVPVISPELINEPLNLYAYLFFMGFIATIGYKIASLGTMLIRPVVVKMKATNEMADAAPPPPAIQA